jgi:UDP-glucose 4-epimerase
MLFIRRPSIDFFTGIKVTKDTVLNFENEIVKQTLENLVLHTVQTTKGNGYEATYDTTVYLEDGDVLIFEEEGRGYLKPYGESFVTVEEAIEDLTNIKDIGGDD